MHPSILYAKPRTRARNGIRNFPAPLVLTFQGRGVEWCSPSRFRKSYEDREIALKARDLALVPTLAWLLASGAGAPTAAAAPPAPETILPADTDVILFVPDMDRLRTKWTASPVGRLWGDSDFAALRREQGWGWESDSLAAELGTGIEGILANFTGSLALSLGDLSSSVEGSELGPIGLVAGVKDVPAFIAVLNRLLALRQESTGENETVREREEVFRGTTLHLRRYLNRGELWALEGWTVLGNLAIVAGPEAYLKSLVTWANVPPASPLSSSPAFREAENRLPRADLSLFVDLGAFSDLLETSVESRLEEEGTNAAGVSPGNAVEALSLDALQAFYVAVDLGEAETRVESGVLYEKPVGLLGLAAYLPGPCTKPAFLPADVLSAGVARFDFKAAWDRLLEIVETVQPGFGEQLGGQLAAYGEALGVDFERDLLGSLGRDFWSAEFPHPTTVDRPWPFLDEVMGIEAADPSALERVLAAVTLALDPTGEVGTDTTKLGVVVHPLPFGPEPGTDESTPCLALHGGWLLFGRRGDLVRLLETMHQPGPSLWERADLQPLFAAVPPEASFLLYQDGTQNARELFELLDRGREETPHPLPGEGDTLWVSTRFSVPQPAQDAILRAMGPLVGYGGRTEKGLFTSYRLLHTGR